MMLPMVSPRSIAHRVQIHLRIGQFQIVEEHAVEVVVVVLPRVRQNRIEILPASC